ncbi:hypothetical protein PO909_002069 [Leuciscus waleckii]
MDQIEVAALGRPLFIGTLYDCRKDSFIPGVTLWDVESLSEHLDTHPQPHTDLKISASDTLSSKFSLIDLSASLKASFLGGLVEVEGSGKFLHDTKSSNQQSSVTLYYGETSRYEHLTMTQLSKFTYPQVFDQKTATHVVTAVLYGAQAFMVFDRTFSQSEHKQKIEGKLHAMVSNIPKFNINGDGSANMTDSEKKIAENIACTFHGDFHLEQSPTTYMQALDLYQKLPSMLKENPKSAVPIKVWLYPLNLLNTKAAQLVRQISTHLVYSTEVIMDELEKVERTCNDLIRNELVDRQVFSDINERLLSFQDSFSIYKLEFQKAVSKVLPAIRGEEGMNEKSLEDILKIHHDSPYNANKLNHWLHEAKLELDHLSFYIKALEGIEIEVSCGVDTILLDPEIDVVVCFTFTSLEYEDPYISVLKEFLKSDKFQELDVNKSLFSVAFIREWFKHPGVSTKMRENLSHFKSFSKARKDDKSIRFIISAISDASNPGSSIYLYEQGNLTDKHFQPVSKPPPPIVKSVLDQTVSLKLQKSPTGETVQYRVEYKQVKADSGAEGQWLVINTADEDFTLTGLESGKHYLIRYRIVGKVGVSEASDIVIPIPSSVCLLVQPVIVGGPGGVEFSIMRSSRSTIKKITITFDKYTMKSIQVNFNNGDVIKVGRPTGDYEHEFLFDADDKIVAATLWPSFFEDRLSGLEFVVAKSDGARTTLSLKGGFVGDPVRVDVKSGKCFGFMVRIGDHIDALGFNFI